MTVKDPVKNQEYVAKHRKNVRQEMGEEAYKKMEAEARRLRRQKEKERKALEANTLPPLDLNALKNYTSLPSLDINNLINLLPPPPPPPRQQKKRGRKPKQTEDITDNMTAKEKRRIYIRNYMRNYRKEQQ
jgi:hypothetical protein